jgi:hypothetical protein
MLENFDIKTFTDLKLVKSSPTKSDPERIIDQTILNLAAKLVRQTIAALEREHTLADANTKLRVQVKILQIELEKLKRLQQDLLDDDDFKIDLAVEEPEYYDV